MKSSSIKIGTKSWSRFVAVLCALTIVRDVKLKIITAVGGKKWRGSPELAEAKAGTGAVAYDRGARKSGI